MAEHIPWWLTMAALGSTLAAQNINPIAYVPDLISHPDPDLNPGRHR